MTLDRNPEVFKTIFQYTQMVLNKYTNRGNFPDSWGKLKILDATVIRLSLSLFPWAHYRKTTSAVKMHTLYDLLSGSPENIIVTEGIIHDKEKMSSFIKNPGMTYLFDRGYIDYEEFDKYCKQNIFFISRLKKNAVIEILNQNGIAKDSSVLCDKEVFLGSIHTKMQSSLRIIQVIDSETNEPFYIVTNRFDLTTDEIADIYRLRWQIELFFKWIKQHFKIKRFYGTSINAVLNQLYAALILYCLLKLIHIKLGLKHNFLKIVRLIANGLFNTIAHLKNILTSAKPPGKRKHNSSWKKDYEKVLKQYNLQDKLYM